ncbi:MAG: glycosyltransferase family 4 protein [Clostridiales bacterium]|nr:glycosyltransferase family 4 protein [Clostridiales bacterium]
MNIWLITHLYPTPDRGDLAGDADALHDFAACWVREGHRVTVLHAYMDKPVGLKKLGLLLPRMRAGRASFDGVDVVRVEMRLAKSVLWLRRLFMNRAGDVMRGMLAGAPAPDLILNHFPALTLGLAGRLRQRCPAACVVHTTDISMLRHKGVSAMPGGFGAVGFRSERIRADFRRLCGDALPGFMALSGAPDLAFGAADRPDGPLGVLYAGKLIARKQVPLLVRALAQLPPEAPWRLTVAGDGPERAAIEREVADLGVGDRVRLTGRLDRMHVFAEMATHDVFAMVSHGETFGIAYLEAMAAGMIPIGTTGEGIDGVIRDGENGFLVNRDDRAALTARFGELANLGAGGRRAIAERALATARAMTAPEMARRYLQNAMEELHFQ